MVRNASTSHGEPASEAALVAVAHQLREIGVEVDPAFVDAGIDTDRSVVLNWRVKDQPLLEDVRRRYEAAAREISIEYLRADLFKAQKDELDQLVSELATTLRAAGVRPTSWGQLDGFEHPYVITFVAGQAPPIELTERFQIFGAGSVVFREGEVISLIGRGRT